MIQVLLLSPRWNSFSSPCSYQTNFFSVSGRVSPKFFEMYSIRPYQYYSFRCWFSNNSILAFVVRVLSQDLVSSIHSIAFFHFFRRLCNVAFFSHHLELWGSCSFMLIHLTGVLCPLLKFFSSYQVSYHFSTGVLPEFVLPCSSFQMECFQLRSSLLYSFFPVVQPLVGLWFHSFVKEATLCYLFLFRFSLVPS